MKDEKLKSALELLAAAIVEAKQKPKDRLRFAALAKTFEVAFEYGWKLLKRAADQAGLEVYSPRDAIKAGAQLGLIADIEVWNQFLNARNLSVHDYIGVDNFALLPLTEGFHKSALALLQE